jgi:hypothetical protein
MVGLATFWLDVACLASQVGTPYALFGLESYCLVRRMC